VHLGLVVVKKEVIIIEFLFQAFFLLQQFSFGPFELLGKRVDFVFGFALFFLVLFDDESQFLEDELIFI
jgi:hypothetical protein